MAALWITSYLGGSLCQQAEEGRAARASVIFRLVCDSSNTLLIRESGNGWNTHFLYHDKDIQLERKWLSDTSNDALKYSHSEHFRHFAEEPDSSPLIIGLFEAAEIK
jgi:hypothetical protein